MAKALYVLAGYDDNTEKYLSGIQNKLYESGFVGTQTKNIPMHTTLGSFPCEKEEELVEYLKKLSAEEKAFDVTFNHVGMFGGGAVHAGRQRRSLRAGCGHAHRCHARHQQRADHADAFPFPGYRPCFHHFRHLKCLRLYRQRSFHLWLRGPLGVRRLERHHCSVAGAQHRLRRHIAPVHSRLEQKISPINAVGADAHIRPGPKWSSAPTSEFPVPPKYKAEPFGSAFLCLNYQI